MSAVKAKEKETIKSYDHHAVGRRKSSVARVYMTVKGTGKIMVNKRSLEDYFPKKTDQFSVYAPLKTLQCEKDHDIYVNVKGGGSTGQAGAIRLGVARLLLKYNLENRATLKQAGFLSRDSRKVERKKAGLAGARRRFQFSKR